MSNEVHHFFYFFLNAKSVVFGFVKVDQIGMIRHTDISLIRGNRISKTCLRYIFDDNGQQKEQLQLF